jgi:hypothetical protein
VERSNPDNQKQEPFLNSNGALLNLLKINFENIIGPTRNAESTLVLKGDVNRIFALDMNP